MNKNPCALLLAVLLPAAMLLALPAHAGSGEDSKELERARQELEAARDELKRAAQELKRVAREQGRESPRAQVFQFMADENRAMLGIIMGRGPSRDGKLAGVRVDAVTPGGGADKAGLKAGDVITTLNGKSIAQDDPDDVTPGRKLRDALDELKLGDKVRVGYERDSRKAETTVIASRLESFEVPAPPLPPLPPLLAFEDDEEHDILLPGLPRMRFAMRDQAPWPLVELDDNLSAYFKTRSGVLVAKAEPGDPLGLKSGDVIQKINGEAVKTPREVLRHLARIESDDEVKLDVVRAGKSETLKGKAPKRERRERRKHIEIETGEVP